MHPAHPPPAGAAHRIIAGGRRRRYVRAVAIAVVTACSHDGLDPCRTRRHPRNCCGHTLYSRTILRQHHSSTSTSSIFYRARRGSSHPTGSAAMALFKPFRALGHITDDTPFAVQRRGREAFVTLSVGQSWQVRA